MENLYHTMMHFALRFAFAHEKAKSPTEGGPSGLKTPVNAV